MPRSRSGTPSRSATRGPTKRPFAPWKAARVTTGRTGLLAGAAVAMTPPGGTPSPRVTPEASITPSPAAGNRRRGVGTKVRPHDRITVAGGSHPLEHRGEPLAVTDAHGLRAVAHLSGVWLMQTVLGLAAAGIGLAVVPSSVATLHRDGVVLRPLYGPTRAVTLAAVHRPEPSVLVGGSSAACRAIRPRTRRADRDRGRRSR